MTNGPGNTISDFHQLHDTHVKNERSAKKYKRFCAAVGGIALISTGTSLLLHDIPTATSGAVVMVTAGGAGEALRRSQNSEAVQAQAAAQSAAEVVSTTPGMPMESWIIKALPEEEGNQILQQDQSQDQ